MGKGIMGRLFPPSQSSGKNNHFSSQWTLLIALKEGSPAWS